MMRKTETTQHRLEKAAMSKIIMFSYKEYFVLEGSECSSNRRLDNTSDSEMLLTHSWFDVTVFTTCREKTLRVKCTDTENLGII